MPHEIEERRGCWIVVVVFVRSLGVLLTRASFSFPLPVSVRRGRKRRQVGAPLLTPHVIFVSWTLSSIDYCYHHREKEY